jgi:hypothetical protein
MYRHVIRFVSFVAGNILSRKQILATLALLLCLFTSQAQTIFPVQSTTRILPPYSVYLADYAVNGNDKLQCILVNRDATQTTYQVRLRLTVKLNGRVIMQTSPGYNPPAITLSPNIAQVFAGATLEPYLKSENLDFIGYSQELYEQNRALPEGFYEIGFAAFDYLRQDVQVSNDGWGFYFLAKNEPPLINLPACGTKLPVQYSTPIRFTWLPRNTASLNSVNSTIYRFFLYEVNPKGANPNDIVNSLPPIYVDSTPLNQTFFDLIPTTNLFRDSFQYAWRVQAADINGADLFRNNGFSEVCTFTWGGPGANPAGSLDPVLNLNALGETERKGRMWWTKDLVKFDGYKVYYKKSGSGYSWFTSETDKDTLRVLDLEPDTEYECRIQGQKNGSYGIYSDVKYFRTKKIVPVECSNRTDVPPVSNGRPLLNLLRGSTITYRDFNILVTDSIVSKGNGMFAGKGAVSVGPPLGLLFEVRFENIFIDDAGMVSQGEIHFVSRDLQAWWKEKRDEQEGGNNVGEVISGNATANYTTNYDITSPNNIMPVLPIINGSTNIIIIRPDNTRDTLRNISLPYTIQDKDGDVYSIDKNGQVTSAGKVGAMPGLNAATLNKLSQQKAKVTFKQHPAQLYGFDGWQSNIVGKNLIEKEYERIVDSATNTPYYVANKSIGASKTDKVIAKIEIFDTQLFTADSVRFVTGKGTLFNAAKTSVAGEYEVNLIGGPGNDAQELFAIHPTGSGQYATLGKLKLVSYYTLVKQIVLVPVTDNITDITPVQQSVNDWFKTANVQVSIQQDKPFTYTGWDKNKDSALDVSGSGLFSQYTSEMRSLNAAYKAQRYTDKNKLYLFVVKKSAGVQGIEGDMPRGSQFGYLFSGALGTDKKKIAKTIAHELGHGAFNLKHTFDEAIGLPLKSSQNVMDYTSNYTTPFSLYKFQWDQMHDPGTVDPIFEADADGQAVNIGISYLSEFKNPIDGNYTFITPSGKYITLPKTTKDVTFSTLDRLAELSNNRPSEELVPLGSLISFTDDQNVHYNLYVEGTTFKGYIRAGTKNTFYRDTISADYQERPGSGIALFIGVKANKFVGYISRFPSIAATPALDATMQGAGPLLKDLAVIPLGIADMDLPIAQILNSKKAHSVLKEQDNISVLFSNGDIVFNYADGNKTLTEFMLQALVESSKLKDYLGFFNFANLKRNEVQAFATCLESQLRYDLTQLAARVRNAINTAAYGESGRLNQGPAMFKDIKARTLEELMFLANTNLTIATLLRQAAIAQKPADTLHAIIKNNYVPCAFGAIDYNTRLYILNKFLSLDFDNDRWYTNPQTNPFADDGSFILKPLIESTPVYDQVKLLKEGFMNNNYFWLRRLWSDANAELNGVAYIHVAELLNIVTGWVKKHYKDLSISSAQYTGMLNDVEGPVFYKYSAGSVNYYLGLRNNEEFNVTPSYIVGLYQYGTPSDITFQSDGKIRFKQNYYRYNTNSYFYDLKTSTPNRQTWVTYDEIMDPFELMNITIADNYAELGFNRGDQFLIPAYLAMLYAKNIEKKIVERRLEFVSDLFTIASAILAAPETGGLSFASISLFFSRVEAIATPFFMRIKAEKATLTTQQLESNRGFYEGWDDFMEAVSDAGLGADYIDDAIKKATKFHLAANAWNKFNDYCKKNITSIPGQIKIAWNTFRANKFFTTISKEKVRELLPNEFMSVLKDFGKSEDEILEYFKVYHNDRSKAMFFNDIDNLITTNNLSNLTKDEAFALWGYTTNFFYYDLNNFLRTSENLARTTSISRLLNNALNKLPYYTGEYVYRGIAIEPDKLDEFLNTYASGKIHPWKNFTSCGGSIGASYAERDHINIIFKIKHLNAKDISNFSDGIKYGNPPMPKPEILIKSGSIMRVVSTPTFDVALGKWVIQIQQVQ